MHWNSLGEFFAMGGYALYVWGSFGACALLLVMEPLLVKQRLSAVRRLLRRERLAESLDKNYP
ncbi:MAG: heme exporter protein CcmD [Rhodocyclales bacterium]|jgi:heme exporter protein D|nr:heme exporter protein CcmD [Rhodocyclales bacterium]MBT9462386.1 heme exporter protein CcmD [Rugosibacter sp.]MBH1975527.1 heme exporter protein CcmD [Rhodocyclales bacterium]MDD2947357.1 heme exporter protein CcmD [Rugosibacter sp.]MDD3380423.1 heme exporter protein CcmD [Rugosibacter sp.]